MLPGYGEVKDRHGVQGQWSGRWRYVRCPRAQENCRLSWTQPRKGGGRRGRRGGKWGKGKEEGGEEEGEGRERLTEVEWGVMELPYLPAVVRRTSGLQPQALSSCRTSPSSPCSILGGRHRILRVRWCLW